MRVTFSDAYDDIAAGSAKARSYVAWWRAKYSTIAPAVEAFVHERLFAISSAEVLAKHAEGSHALGEIERHRQLREVEDTRMPDTAMQDVFHRFVEERGLPTWQEFHDYLLEADIKPLILTPWWNDLRAKVARYSEERVRDALHWRIGRMYYSNMREVHFLARVRELRGIQLRYHIFADVRLRTDFWIDNHNVSVFLSNPEYRGASRTRKQIAKERLDDHKPPLIFHEVEFPNRYDRGELYVVDDTAIEALADALDS